MILANSLLSKSNTSLRAGRRNKKSFPSLLESLESRVLLSGTVAASVAHGVLTVRGDNSANAIVLDQVGLNGDQVRITGTDGTGINGQNGAVVLSGITQGAMIRMGASADSVTLQNANFPGSVTVSDRGGGNVLIVNNVHVAASLNVQNGQTMGTSTIAGVTIGKDLMILAGNGGQKVSLEAVQVTGKTRIASSGKGADGLTIDDSTFHGATTLFTGQGNDHVQIDANGDPLGPPTLFESTVLVSLNGGDDVLQLGVAGQTGNRSDFAGKVHFLGGGGFDTLQNFAASTYNGNARFWIQNFESTTTAADTTAPTVSFTSPADTTTGVALNKKIAATFSEAMAPLTINTNTVSVTGPGQTVVAGTVAYSGTTMTFTPTSVLTANSVYTVTIGTGATDIAGNALAQNFVWTFTTGATSDTTAPTVSSSDPAGNATGVALNKKIAAVFSEAMDPLTITAANVTVTGPGQAVVAGSIGYVGTTLTFTPASTLAAGTLYTLKISTGVKDLAGNALASNFVSSFTTGSTTDTIAPTVILTSPTNLQTNVAINKTVGATFSEAMDPLTITTANFTLTGPGNAAVAGGVTYDAASKIASFAPTSNLTANTTYTATLKGGASGVKDLAGNALVVDKVWTFTTGTQIAQAPINLGSAGAFAVMATASITSSGPTVINGDVGLNPGDAQGIPPAQVNGTIHVDDQAIIKAQADLLSAYNDAVSRSTTSVALPGNMGGLTFTPGLYTNSSSVLIQGAGPNNNVTLDAQGDPNAIFIFKMSSTLTTGPGAQVILAGGAKATNIYWQVGSSATIDTTTIFKGNVLAAVTITVNSGAAIEGRLLAGSNSAGSVTISASTVTVPSA